MDWILELETLLKSELPGLDAQMKMAPPIRTRSMDAPEDARLGGVLILLMETKNEWNTVLIRRTEDGHTHSGQISFPGGKYDRTDADIIATALRECEEEIGVPRHSIQVLGTLSPLYIPPSNFLVTPTVGYVSSIQSFRPSENEVQEIIQVPLHLLFDPSVKSEQAVRRSDDPNQEMKTPVYALNDDIVIWGATAMMISEFEHIIQTLNDTRKA